MGKTLVEKLLSLRSNSDVSAGDIVVLAPDRCILTDGNGPLVVKRYSQLSNSQTKIIPIIAIDHHGPSPRKEYSNEAKILKQFAESNHGTFYPAGNGILHQLHAEKFANIGDVIIGSDSHSVTAGAFGCFSTGMGATDIASTLYTGNTWLNVPETIKVILNGELPQHVSAKDINLKLLTILGNNGANYCAIEYTGPLVERLSMAERMTLTNMSIELGAKAGIVPADQITIDYIKDHSRVPNTDYILTSDPDAKYKRIIEVDCSQLSPMIAAPHHVENIEPVKNVLGTKIDQVNIGTCTNGRFEDLEIASRVLRGHTVAESVRLFITPASKEVYQLALKKGVINDLVEAGAIINPPGCGSCVGIHMGVLADGEVCLTTQNRNFKGRMGNPNAYIYLSSPLVAAVSAIKGEITDPQEVLENATFRNWSGLEV